VPESDIDEAIRRLVGGLGKAPRELFDALGNQTIDLVLTAHPTQSVRLRRYAPHAGTVRTLSTADDDELSFAFAALRLINGGDLAHLLLCTSLLRPGLQD